MCAFLPLLFWEPGFSHPSVKVRSLVVSLELLRVNSVPSEKYPPQKGKVSKASQKAIPQKLEERQAKGNLHIRSTLLLRNDAPSGGLLST